mgnify:CR=1 FL=1
MDKEQKPTEQLVDETFREYAWNYFSLHADQRLRAFHFYITLSTALIGSFLLLLRYGQGHKWLAILGMLLFFFSFVFAKLDRRTRDMIQHAEDALKFLDSKHDLPDQDGKAHPLKLFHCDDEHTARAAPFPLVVGYFSYSRCFRWVFNVFGVTGIIAACAALSVFPP